MMTMTTIKTSMLTVRKNDLLYFHNLCTIYITWSISMDLLQCVVRLEIAD